MSPSLQNITITAPNGTSDHGDPHLLCTPSTWTDIAIFFLAHFVSHAATVKSLPGEPMAATWLAELTALLLPVSGIVRGINAIYSRAVFGKTPLETAARAGALCTVVRSDKWEPKPGDKIKIPIIRPPPKDMTQHEVPWNERMLSWSERRLFWSRRMLYWSEGKLASSGRMHSWGERMLSWSKCTNPKSPNFLLILFKRLREQKWSSGGGNQELSDVSKLKLRIHHSLLSTFRPSPTGLNIRHRHVYGTCSLPEGYALSLISHGARVQNLEGRQVYSTDAEDSPNGIRVSSTDFGPRKDLVLTIISPRLRAFQKVLLPSFKPFMPR